MGTWGSGNFDSDTAADHLGILTAKLIEEVEDAMGDPAQLEPDEYWGVAVPCNIELLVLIAKQHFVGCQIPEVETVKAWRDTYMQVWESHIDALAPKPDHKTERRKALERTIRKLLEISQREHEG